MSSPEHKEKIWKLISDIGTGMLVSLNNHELHARPMQLVQDEYDGTLWFFTQDNGPKVQEIAADSNVCLTFADTSKNVYVSLTGTATLTTDQKLIDKFWNPVVSSWYPDGRESSNLALLEIKIKRGEHWDADTNPISFWYEVAKANMTNKRPNLGENQKFN